MMAADLKGKTALVTGSGKKAGIGYGIVRKLAECGVNVIITDLVGKETRQNEPLTNDMAAMTHLAKDMEKAFKIKAIAVAWPDGLLCQQTRLIKDGASRGASACAARATPKL
jgi:NAD(P)-dependent dehydrogenase (short-subunit alcohol dehydrogenase family)